MPERLLPMAKIYIQIVGSGMLLTAIMSALSTVIRNTGNTKGPMVTAVGMNIVHVILNYGFIFGAFGFPQLGLTGVACSTVISRFIAVILLLFMFFQSFERRIQFKELLTFDKSLFKEILKIGWPLGVSNGNWVFSQLIIFTFIALLGPIELAARTYMSTLESFCNLLGMSVAMGAQIQIAHLYGLGGMVLGWFTEDTEIIAIGVSLLALNVLLQPGKMVNMALNSALNAVGDTKFTMITSLLSMWIVATAASYLLSIHWGLGLLGIYICMITDEYIRGLCAFLRWRGQRYLRIAQQLPVKVWRPWKKRVLTIKGQGSM